MSRKNLIIGAVRGYTFKELQPFVASLRQTTFDGDLVLLWNNLSPETLALLEREGVKLVYFPYRGNAALNSWSRFWPKLRPWLRLPLAAPFRKWIYGKILNLAFVRYLHVLWFLEQHQGKYEKILFTDVRDVFFQDDPFRESLTGDIAVFLETPELVHGACWRVDDWLVENYGHDMLDQLLGKRITCCGTVMGTETGMLRYLRAFIAEIIHLKSTAHGADTSIHTVLTYDLMKEKITVVENMGNAIGTIGVMNDFQQDADGWVLQADGARVPVVHQYDRHQSRFTQLLKRFESDVGSP